MPPQGSTTRGPVILAVLLAQSHNLGLRPSRIAIISFWVDSGQRVVLWRADPWAMTQSRPLSEAGPASFLSRLVARTSTEFVRGSDPPETAGGAARVRTHAGGFSCGDRRRYPRPWPHRRAQCVGQTPGKFKRVIPQRNFPPEDLRQWPRPGSWASPLRLLWPHASDEGSNLCGIAQKEVLGAWLAGRWAGTLSVRRLNF